MKYALISDIHADLPALQAGSQTLHTALTSERRTTWVIWKRHGSGSPHL